jgi:hypothetical protein
MNHPEPAAVGRLVDGVANHFNATKVLAQKLAGKLVVVSWHKYHPATLASAAKQFLHHIVVGLRPMPTPAQLPAVNDVAHQIKRLAGVVLEKVEQGLGLKPGRAQVQIRDEHRAKFRRRFWLV